MGLLPGISHCIILSKAQTTYLRILLQILFAFFNIFCSYQYARMVIELYLCPTYDCKRKLLWALYGHWVSTLDVGLRLKDMTINLPLGHRALDNMRYFCYWSFKLDFAPSINHASCNGVETSHKYRPTPTWTRITQDLCIPTLRDHSICTR